MASLVTTTPCPGICPKTWRISKSSHWVALSSWGARPGSRYRQNFARCQAVPMWLLHARPTGMLQARKSQAACMTHWRNAKLQVTYGSLVVRKFMHWQSHWHSALKSPKLHKTLQAMPTHLNWAQIGQHQHRSNTPAPAAWRLVLLPTCAFRQHRVRPELLYI